ncbi:MAG: glycosyltransferase family 4 protein [Lewinellaceae bacterium]|nr:glycosyltransferase family 4 protein [Lewinellaceae bacterium]
MSKTIALVANSTWNIYNFRQPLIKQLKAAGFRVLVIAPVDEYIHYLNDSYFTRHIPLRFLAAQRKNPLWDLLLLWELFRIYRRERPALILHFTIKPNIFGSLAARLAGIPSVATVTGLGYSFIHKGLLAHLARALYRLAFRQVTKAAFHNSEDRQLFLAGGLVQEAQSLVIPGSGVNTNHFRPLPQPHNDKFIFLFIGRLLYDKGIREFVAAARQLRRLAPRAECWVVGQLNAENPSAVSQQELLQWLEEHHIRYFGATHDVRPFLKQADALVLPSYREGLPRAILEAMSMGKPIITTDVPGCQETVEEGRNGFLVPAQDGLALAEAMVRLYQLDNESLQAMGDYSREKVLREFDEKLIVAAYLKLCREILEGRSEGKPVHGGVIG